MSANYWASSQRNKWQFTREEITEARQEIELVERQMFGDNPVLSGCKYDINMRIYLHQLIVKLGRRLSLRQIIMSTAEVYLTRFLLRASIKEVNVYLLVATCIYVACKIEECPQHIRTILSEARNCWPEFIPNDLTKLAEFEFYLIDEMDCYLIVHHPYNSLVEITKTLKSYDETSARLEITPDELQSCWSIINDSYILDLHLLFPPHIIGIASLYLTLILEADVSASEGKDSTGKDGKIESANISMSDTKADTGTSTYTSNDSSTSRFSPSRGTSHNRNLPQSQQLLQRKISVSSTLKRNLQKRPRAGQTSNAQFSPRVETFLRFLAASNINLDEVIETVQELLTLYDSWNYYDELSVRNATHSMLLTLNSDHNG
ncbi:DEKNAAC104577 [Brettanomyces naardenensis]|uniref:DEKNAAC104577 n=1 Tax=Brettanomyces naardenensis TaxID=13370 RepID=A0A448YR51_BRENA|nr:DEKNAAC104577 [Brettanomyces naardenensis]